MSLFTPADISWLKMFWLLERAAICRAVCPSWFCKFVSTPTSSRRLTVLGWFSWQARCSAEYPLLFWAFAFTCKQENKLFLFCKCKRHLFFNSTLFILCLLPDVIEHHRSDHAPMAECSSFLYFMNSNLICFACMLGGLASSYFCLIVIIKSRGVHKLTFFWPSQVTNHKTSEQVNSQVSSKSLVQFQVKSS